MIRRSRRAQILVAATLVAWAAAAVIAVVVTGGDRPRSLAGHRTTALPRPPDRDRDRVSDDRDQCPDTFGTGPPPGCPPDRDGDGLPDSKDKCPDSAARTKTGCPEEVKGLSKFFDTDALDYSGGGETGTTRISGLEPVFNDAIWGRLSAHSSSGFDGFTLTPDQAYDRIRGTVGIKVPAQCSKNKALVSITDDQGTLLWKADGPVTIRRRVRFDVRIRGARQLEFVNKLAQPADGLPLTCDDALTEPAWGGVELVRSGG